MNELDLYKFINDNMIEIEWRGESLIIWVPFCHMEELTAMVSNSYFEDDVEVTWFDDSICFDLCDLCEYHEIDPERILSKEEN